MKPELTTAGFGESRGWGCPLQAPAMGRGSRDKGSGERPPGFSIRPIVSSFSSSNIHMSRVSILSFPYLVPVSGAHHLPSIGPEKEDLRGNCSVAQQDRSDMPGVRAETCLHSPEYSHPDWSQAAGFPFALAERQLQWEPISWSLSLSPPLPHLRPPLAPKSHLPPSHCK